MLNHIKNAHLLNISQEVKEALDNGLPIVALESTVICHGLPYPQNKETALKIEAAVRDAGSIPATVGIENGKFIIGMTKDDIDRFASTAGIPKVSSRDIPIILAGKGMGATTVASSIVAADLAGIDFFASAGIGGVHRGAEKTMDISADLIQFTRSRVAIVCAGAKSILDLGLTMEYLETQCVPIISYKSDDFPAFYCESSGIKSPHRIDNENDIASAIEMHRSLGNIGSVLITHPIASEDAIDSEYVNDIICKAVKDAEVEGVTGPAATPYIMKAVGKATNGATVKANMSVLISTAAVASVLAKQHAEFKKEYREKK
ncbi:MAG: pseudouridine-5'-phosphate glycosidase [Bacteroidetes bacterium]|nr:pseudouridine-5'-phosphate glycosidase [Bacteroidota bacterium]